MLDLRIAIAIGVSALCCALAVPFVRRMAIALGAVDHPDERRLHAQPTPRLGGVAMFIAFAVVLGGGALYGPTIGGVTRANPQGVLGFAIAAAIVFVTGVIDDLRGLPARVKLVPETLAALVVVLSGFRVDSVSSPWGPLPLGYLAVPLTVAWIVAVTNALNLMDGLDGLAAGVAAIAFATILALTDPHRTVALLAAVLLGACVGFLFHNLHPASIFMGDSGSLLLGLALGVLSTHTSQKARTGAITLVPLLILALPLTDTAWAVVRRYARGLVPTSVRSHLAGFARIVTADRQHIHHRLIAAGVSQRRATYLLYLLQGATCCAAIYLVMLWGLG